MDEQPAHDQSSQSLEYVRGALRDVLRDLPHFRLSAGTWGDVAQIQGEILALLAGGEAETLDGATVAERVRMLTGELLVLSKLRTSVPITAGEPIPELVIERRNELIDAIAEARPTGLLPPRPTGAPLPQPAGAAEPVGSPE